MEKVKPTFKVDHEANTEGTSPQGKILARYFELDKAFGKPVDPFGHEVTCHWTFTDDDDNVFTLYDWKKTALYSNQLPLPNEIKASSKRQSYRIGGHDLDDDNERIRELVRWITEKVGYNVDFVTLEENK